MGQKTTGRFFYGSGDSKFGRFTNYFILYVRFFPGLSEVKSMINSSYEIKFELIQHLAGGMFSILV